MDLPATPWGSLFLTSDLYQVMNVAIGLNPSHPIDVDSLKSFISNSTMLKLPRFSSLLLANQPPNCSTEYSHHYLFRPTRVDIDRHVIVVNDRAATDDDDDEEDVVNSYLAELAATEPMSLDKPLWEVHVLVDVNCLVLRVHHAVCDGMTLLSVIKEMGTGTGTSINVGHCTGRTTVTGSSSSTTSTNSISSSSNSTWWKRLLGYLAYIWFSLVFCTQFALRLYVADKKTVLNTVNNNGDHDHDHDHEDRTKAKKVRRRLPQRLATARFSFDDFSVVKKAVEHSTVNDVLIGILWGGFVRYVDATTSENDVREGQQITGLSMVNMRKQRGLMDISKALTDSNKHDSRSPSSSSSSPPWLGNKFSTILVPIHYTSKVADPLDYVRKAKSMMDKKKQSCEPLFVAKLIEFVTTAFGLKVMKYLMERVSRHATFAISNMVGPSEGIMIGGRPVTYIRMSLCSAPMNIVMHMVSYMKNLDLQILVAKDVVPDPKFLAQCFKETLQAMKDSAEETLRKEIRIKFGAGST